MIVRLTRSAEIAQLAATAGFDSLYVDLEHASFTLETTGAICMAALAAGITPLVRVPGVGEVSRVLDAGALGIIAPHVRSAAEARDYVTAAKFPPLGERSAAGALPHLHYRSFPAAAADAAMNAATMVVVQFESEEALKNADEIVAVDGVDMVLIGSNDMLASFGLTGQYEHPRLREAYAKTIEVCRRHNKHVGVGGLSSRPDLAAQFVKMGARYVSTGTDLSFLLAACAAKAKEVHAMAST
jgi:4-hydroxy-2-oxoheptanedioate aldolase